MATKRQRYWATLRRARVVFDLTLSEARVFWRIFTDMLFLSTGQLRPFGTDLDRHPRLARRAIAELRRRLLPPPPPLPPPAPPPEIEEWEITVRYGQVGSQREHITVRALGPAGATKEIVRRVFWRALNGRVLDYWKLTAIDWQRISRRGVEQWTKRYEIVDIATPVFRNLMQYARVRIARVEE